MPYLEKEAEKRMLAGKKVDPSPNSDQGLLVKRGTELPVSTNSDGPGNDQHHPRNRAGKAAQHAAKLAGVGATAIYESEPLIVISGAQGSGVSYLSQGHQK